MVGRGVGDHGVNQVAGSSYEVEAWPEADCEIRAEFRLSRGCRGDTAKVEPQQ
jgi:hypothetical protein